MNEHFAFWYPSSWTMIGTVFSIFSFLVTLYVTFVRRDVVVTAIDKLRDVYETIRDESWYLRSVRTDVDALRKTLAPPGESTVEMHRTLQGLRTDLQALATATRENREDVNGLMTESQAPAIPVLLEILAEVWKVTTREPKIQRRLPPFSRHLMVAQAEALARERMQANPNPFQDLD
ncbi:hypothetical protein C7974DRAFT_427071 [Boeremia exigua]|uniref:uncharacterized protein n=1 Tax=Boeremia exigua TaxID=749465 RepID=UPI001E8E1B41|nr:uncharacterized protein C7974DRAFT_427071 [Boeremia exigua]KAH6618835.1 hypothetical protein C7974DRAFT_427071 [Boeremia exigua]